MKCCFEGGNMFMIYPKVRNCNLFRIFDTNKWLNVFKYFRAKEKNKMPSPKSFLQFLILTISLMIVSSVNSAAQQLELVVQTGHTSDVLSVAFSPDGKTLASGSFDSTVKLWDVQTGQQIRSLEGHTDIVPSVAFSPDGKTLASGSCYRNKRPMIKGLECLEGEIKLWNIETGEQVISMKGDHTWVTEVAFSPDGKTLASRSFDKTIKLWNVETGQLLKSLEGHTDTVNSVAFSPDGKTLATGSSDKSVKLWNVETGQLLKSLEGHIDSVNSVAFSVDGKTLASGSGDNTIKLWNVETGQLFKSLEGHNDSVNSVVFSPDGKTLAKGSWYQTTKLWNVETGQLLKSLEGETDSVLSFAFSPDGKTLASGSQNKTIKLWNAETGQLLKTLESHTNWIGEVAFSPDGKTLALVGNDNTIKLCYTESGQLFKSLKGHTWSVNSVAFSPDGKTLATGSSDKTIKLWNVETGQLFKSLKRHTDSVISVAFSPDGKTLASGSSDDTIKFWKVETGQLLKSLKSSFSTASIEKVAFSPDGKILALSGKTTIIAFDGEDNGIIVLRNVQTGQILKAFQKDDPKTVSEVSAIVPDFYNKSENELNQNEPNSPDGRFQIKRGENLKLNLFDVKSGKLLVSLILLDKDDWVVIDPEGRFDASEGALKLMHYSYGLQTVDLEQFKDEYFEPGLLQKIFKGERLRAVVPLADAKLPPEIVSQEFEPKSNKLNIKLKNRGGGFGAIRVFVNDKLAIADARDTKLQANPNTAQEIIDLTVDLAGSAFAKGKICEIKDGKQECRDNKITVYTSNYLAAYQTSNITSRGTSIFTVGGDGEDNFKLPTLYAVVGGVSDYAGSALDLKFAAKDAEDFSAALSLGAKQLFCAKENPNCLDKVQITTLSTSGKAGTIQPTKENFRQAFAEIAAKAEPEDIVLVYLSGHGVSLDDTDTYFYLTSDADPTSKDDLTKNYSKISITSNELLCWMTTTPCDAEKTLSLNGKPQIGNKALRQVIILDTCAAGKAGQTLALIAQKDLSTDQRRAIEFLKDKTGTHILMGSTADQPSYEASKFGQGLLTRALLEGMSGAALEKVNGFVDIQTLFRYAENRVEKLAVGIGGIQRPTNAAPSGKTFVIGQMMPTTIEEIAKKLPKEKPYILRPSFGNREDNFDNLGINNALAKILNDQNNPLMIKGGEAVLVYLNEENFTGAIKPTGFYTIEGDTVNVKVSLYRDGQKVTETFEVIANKNEIVEKLLAAIRDKLTTLKP